MKRILLEYAKTNFKIDEMMLVFIVAVVAMIAVIHNKTGSSEMEAEKITEMLLDDHGISFANNGVIDENKLKGIQNMDYDDIKDKLDAKGDFCLIVVDEKNSILLEKHPSNGKQARLCDQIE